MNTLTSPVNPHGKIVIMPSSYCTKEDAVAKLLGWLNSDPMCSEYIKLTVSEKQKAALDALTSNSSYTLPLKCPSNIQSTQSEIKLTSEPLQAYEPSYRIDANELKNIRSLDDTLCGSLDAQLTELYNFALFEFNEAIELDELSEKAELVQYWENQIHRASIYLHDIDDELNKGKKSILLLNKKAPKKADRQLINVSSLDKWSRIKYNISIIKNSAIKTNSSDTSDSGDYIAEQCDVTDKVEPTSANKIYETKLNNIYVTLAYFIEEFAESAPKYKWADTPNAVQIANHFSKVAAATNNYNELEAQTEGNLRKLFSAALKSKTKKNVVQSYIDGKLIPLEKPKAPD